MPEHPPRVPEFLARKERPEVVQEHAELLRAVATRDTSARETLLSRYVLREEAIPASHWDTVLRQYRERGIGVDALPQEIKREHARAIIEDQRSSLGLWVDYLASPDALYPDWAKYWVMREVTALSRYDKEKQRFRSRDGDEGAVAPFPELDPEALAHVVGAVVRAHETPTDLKELERKLQTAKNQLKRFQGAGRVKGYSDLETDAPVGRKLLQEMRAIDAAIDSYLGMGKESRDQVKAGSFAALYARAINELNAEAGAQGGLEHTAGRLVRFTKGSDPQNLYAALQKKRTGWCTADLGTAGSQLEKGDFLIYFSHLPPSDEELVNPAALPKSAQPRLAFRYEEDTLAEVRGILPNQETDSYIGPIRSELLARLPDGERFGKRDADMMRMTDIYDRCVKENADGTKAYLSTPLSQGDLRFLYELDGEIEGFGYQRDPRIDELRSTRDAEADMPAALGCEPRQIARTASEIGKDTKAYVGALTPGIFDTLAAHGIEQVFRKFPEARIERHRLTVEKRRSGADYAATEGAIVEGEPRRLGDWARKMLESKEFKSIPAGEYEAVEVSVEDFGFTSYTRYEDIRKRGEELGLEPLPAALAAEYWRTTRSGRYVIAAMEPITVDGYPSVFCVYRCGVDLWLDCSGGMPGDGWGPGDRFLFRRSRPRK